MRTNSSRAAFSITLALLAASPMAQRGDGKEPDRKWDQQRAVARVEQVLEIEKQGRPWERIAWHTDAEQAIAEARRTDRPILVFLFLKKNVGPELAPC